MLTEDALKKALATAMLSKDNMAYLRDSFEDVAGMPDEDAAAWAADGIYSDKLLEELNKRMESIPVCGMTAFGLDTNEIAEKHVGTSHAGVPDWGAVEMPRAWPGKAVYVGRLSGDGDFYVCKGLESLTVVECWIDEEGTVFGIESYLHRLWLGDVDDELCPCVTYNAAVDASAWTMIPLDDLDDLVPPEFKGFWDT